MPKTPTDHQVPKYGFGPKTKYVDLDLPSGGVAQVRRPDPQLLIREGVLDDLDSLTGAVVSETIPKGQGKAPVTVARPDKDQILKSLAAIDRIVLAVLVQPTVLPVPTDGSERDEDAWYVDEVDLADKNTIVRHAAGGGSDLDSFRASPEESVGGVPVGA